MESDWTVEREAEHSSTVLLPVRLRLCVPTLIPVTSPLLEWRGEYETKQNITKKQG